MITAKVVMAHQKNQGLVGWLAPVWASQHVNQSINHVRIFDVQFGAGHSRLPPNSVPGMVQQFKKALREAAEEKIKKLEAAK